MLTYLKKIILSNQTLYNFLFNTYFLKSYKNTVLKNVLPQLENIGLTTPIAAHGDRIKIFVPYIETAFVKIFVLIVLLKALQIRGAKIIFLICNRGIPICESFSLRTPTGRCKYCDFINKKLIPSLGFDVIEINDCITEMEKTEINRIAVELNAQNISHYNYHGVDIMPVVEDSLMRYYYGANVENSSKKLDYITTALISTKVAHNIHKKYKPDIVVSHMYAYGEFQPYNLYFERIQDVPVYCLKGSAWNLSSININSMELYNNDERFNKYIQSRGNKTLDEHEREELNQFLGDRFGGRNDEFTFYSYFDDAEDGGKIKALNIDKTKKNLFLFSNVEWDVGLGDCQLLFSGVMEWVEYTIDAVKDKDDIHLYIKTHPNEVYGVNSELTVADKILMRYPTLPDNVTLITPEYKIKPYSLFEYIDVGIVYFGTLGLEMALKGIPVIATGLAPYSRKGFVLEPKNRDEYRNMLLAESNSVSIDKELLELFAYFYFIKRMIPFNLVEKFYGLNLANIGYHIHSIADLEPGNDKYLDHLCDCILSGKTIEAW